VLARVRVVYWCLGALVGTWVSAYLIFSRPSISAEDFDAGASDLEELFPTTLEVSDHADFQAVRDPGAATCPTGISGQADTDVQEFRAVVIAEVEGEAVAEQVLAILKRPGQEMTRGNWKKSVLPQAVTA